MTPLKQSVEWPEIHKISVHYTHLVSFYKERQYGVLLQYFSILGVKSKNQSEPQSVAKASTGVLFPPKGQWNTAGVWLRLATLDHIIV